MSKQTDLREIQRLTEDAAIDARKLLIQADNLPPDTFQKMLEALCGSFEDTALQLRRLCEQQSPGTGGYKRGRALRPLEVVGSVERIGIDWLHIRINTLLPHCRFQPPTWLTETLVELLDAYEACGGQLPHFNSALLVIEEYSDVDGRHIFDQDNKGWKAVSNAIKGRVIPDDDQYTLSVALLSTRSCQNVCHITVLDMKDAPDFFSARTGDYSVICLRSPRRTFWRRWQAPPWKPCGMSRCSRRRWRVGSCGRPFGSWKTTSCTSPGSRI